MIEKLLGFAEEFCYIKFDWILLLRTLRPFDKLRDLTRLVSQPNHAQDDCR